MCIYTIPLKNVFIFDLSTMPDPLSYLPELSTTIFQRHFWSMELKLPQVPNHWRLDLIMRKLLKKREGPCVNVNFQALSVGVDVFSILEKHCTLQFFQYPNIQ